MNLFTSFMLRAAAILTRDRLLPALGRYTEDQTLTLWSQVLHLLLPGGTKTLPVCERTFPHHCVPRVWEQDGRKKNNGEKPGGGGAQAFNPSTL